MSDAVKDTNRKTFEICDGIILALGVVFMLYPICVVMMGSPVVKLLGIMEKLRADVPVFLRFFFSLSPHLLSFYSLVFLFGMLTTGAALAARRGKAWARRMVFVAGWIIGVVFLCVFGFWCLTAIAAPEATALLFAVEGTRELVILMCVGLLVLFSVLVSLWISLMRMKRRWEGN